MRRRRRRWRRRRKGRRRRRTGGGIDKATRPRRGSSASDPWFQPSRSAPWASLIFSPWTSWTRTCLASRRCTPP
eukprot:3795660-Pyramimonas_sp.AAC.1